MDDPRPPASSAWRRPVGDLAGPRDRTLLLAATGLGRSALVGLDVEQVHFIEAGVNLVLHGQYGPSAPSPSVASRPCPVRALKVPQ